MSCHSEETWESFDALWRRFEALSRKVRELEARLGAIEQSGPPPFNEGFNSNSVYEGEVHK